MKAKPEQAGLLKRPQKIEQMPIAVASKFEVAEAAHQYLPEDGSTQPCDLLDREAYLTGQGLLNLKSR
jgi:hypothetical protein